MVVGTVGSKAGEVRVRNIAPRLCGREQVRVQARRRPPLERARGTPFARALRT